MPRRIAVAVLLLAFFTGVCRLQPSPELTQYAERFANHSLTVQPKVHNLIAQNHAARLQLIRWIVTELGTLTTELRRMTDEAWTNIEDHKLFNDTCREELRSTFTIYVGLAELDIMLAAWDMNYYMWFDAVHRFTPHAVFINRINTQATHQTVQTLGRHDLVSCMPAVLEDLSDELQYGESLWKCHRKVLKWEIQYIAPMEELVRQEMAWWSEYALYWHQIFMDYSIELVEYFCKCKR